MMPGIVHIIAKQYNEAHVFMEINGLGKAIADQLLMELEYPNVVQISFRGRRGQVFDGGFGDSSKVINPGVQMSGKVKTAGCSLLKSLLENDQLLIDDFHTIQELVSFVLQTKGVYAAEEGAHDDLVMSLILFAWITNEKSFEELTNAGMKQRLAGQQREMELLEDFPDLPIIDSGTEPSFINMGDSLLWETDSDSRYARDLNAGEDQEKADRDWLI
jgi:hypothetical protein